MMNYGELEVRASAVVTKDLVKKLMPIYKRYEDLIIVQEIVWEEFKKSLPVPVAINDNSPFSIDEDELASLVCQTVQTPVICRRLAIERNTTNSDGQTAKSIRLLLGRDGVVTLKDHNILYQFNVTRCVLSSSFENVRERLRLGELDCSNEIVVDLFAGIGHFTLPLLLQAKAKHLYACDWNLRAIEALKKNLKLNNIDPSRCTVIEGDNRTGRPTNVAQRVVIGILPSCFDWLRTAIECIDKRTGGILHCHDLVEVPQHQKSPLPKQDDSTTRAIGDGHSSTSHNPSSSTHASSSPQPMPSQENDKTQHPNDSGHQLSQSISSTSSNSTIEKLSATVDDLSRLVLHTSESEKDTNSPVFLDKPPSCYSTTQQDLSGTSLLDASATSNSESQSNKNDHPSLTSSMNEDSISIIEPPRIADEETVHYEMRGLSLIESIRKELDANELSARLLYIQPVRSFKPNTIHVVFDIKIEPRHFIVSEPKQDVAAPATRIHNEL